MADDLPTVWPAEPHTLAKHAILRRYLDAWFPILSRQSHRLREPSREILFIDGFAGPGEYERGEPGSPVIALKAALEHSVRFPILVRLLFIEDREDRHRHLQGVLGAYKEQISNSKNVRLSLPTQGKCDMILATILDRYEKEGKRFGPALAFLDQFGYSAVSMELIKRILAYPQCEVFSYLDYKDMNRWITDPAKADSFSRTYGGEEWRDAIRLPERERRTFLLETYKNMLETRANVKYVSAFAMFNRSDQLLYWLLFCTNNLRGLEEMKTAMWTVDQTGEFRFSDKDNPDQLSLLEDAYDQDWLADEVASQLAGKELTLAQVKEFVLTETPCRLFKEALRKLENRGELRVTNAPPDRRPGTFRYERLVIRFREPASSNEGQREEQVPEERVPGTVLDGVLRRRALW